MVGTDSCRVSRAPHYLGYFLLMFSFIYATFTLFGRFFQIVQFTLHLFIEVPLPHLNKFKWFGLFRFRSPLLTESHSFYIPAVTEMFHFAAFSFVELLIHSTITSLIDVGFSHSEIHGLTFACNSPWLFATCYVLIRLLAPRHPQLALYILI